MHYKLYNTYTSNTLRLRPWGPERMNDCDVDWRVDGVGWGIPPQHRLSVQTLGQRKALTCCLVLCQYSNTLLVFKIVYSDFQMLDQCWATVYDAVPALSQYVRGGQCPLLSNAPLPPDWRCYWSGPTKAKSKSGVGWEGHVDACLGCQSYQ